MVIVLIRPESICVASCCNGMRGGVQEDNATLSHHASTVLVCPAHIVLIAQHPSPVSSTVDDFKRSGCWWLVCLKRQIKAGARLP